KTSGRSACAAASRTFPSRASSCRGTECGLIRQRRFESWVSRKARSTRRSRARLTGSEKMVTPSILLETRADAERARTCGKIVVAAALGRELRALKRERRSDLLLVETGEGTINASKAINRALETGPRAVLGIGFAGALSSSLEVGDVVVAARVDGIA